MTDLAVLVPSRGRPQNVARLVEACAATCRADTLLAFGFDNDDEALTANLDAIGWKSVAKVLPRMGLVAWTNVLAAEFMLAAGHLASLGDDMVPVTVGWDVRLVEAAGPHGMAYPNDKRRHDIPEAVVVSSSVVRALGWLAEPSLEHWYIDNVWADLGDAAGCLTYLPDVLVEHRHPNVTGEPGDRTYWDAGEKYGQDLAAYQRWRMRRMRDDAGKVMACRAAA